MTSDPISFYNDRRIYWTEQELRIKNREELTFLAKKQGVQLFSRDEMLVRIREKMETDPSVLSEHFCGNPTSLPSTTLMDVCVSRRDFFNFCFYFVFLLIFF